MVIALVDRNEKPPARPGWRVKTPKVWAGDAVLDSKLNDARTLVTDAASAGGRNEKLTRREPGTLVRGSMVYSEPVVPLTSSGALFWKRTPDTELIPVKLAKVVSTACAGAADSPTTAKTVANARRGDFNMHFTP